MPLFSRIISWKVLSDHNIDSSVSLSQLSNKVMKYIIIICKLYYNGVTFLNQINCETV